MGNAHELEVYDWLETCHDKVRERYAKAIRAFVNSDKWYGQEISNLHEWLFQNYESLKQNIDDPTTVDGYPGW